MAIKISGVTLGNISGGPSSIRLEDLADVSIASPIDGQYLTYSSALGEWENTSIGSEIYDFIDGAIIGSDGIVITATPGPNTITLSLGNITPDSIASVGTVTGSNLSGTNTGDQTITLTGDITGTGTGSFATTLATVNSDVGTYGSVSAVPIITVNAKGLITSMSTAPISATAPSLTTARDITATGDGSWSVSFDGSTNVSSALTLATVNSDVGTYGSVSAVPIITVNAKGLITSMSTAPISATAPSLTTARNISATGDATWSVSFDGSADVSSGITFATVNSSPQTDTFRKVSVNGKGLVTATSAVTSGDITTALGFTPLNKAGDTMTGMLVLNADPVSGFDAATKQYVDNIAAGLNAHVAVSVSTTATLASTSAGTVTYNNGTAGVGATLTTTGNFNTIGAYAVANGDRVLVKDEVATENNGVYVRTSATVLTRAVDFDNSPEAEVIAGDFVYVQHGTLEGTQWVLTTTGTIVIGTSGLVFSQLSGAGTYVGGAGINVASNVISNTGVLSAVAGSNISVSSATGNVTIAVTGTVPSADDIANGVAGNIVYQSAPGVTSFLGTGTSSQVLVSGTTPAWSSAPAILGTNITGIPNAGLTNSSVTVGSTNIALGGTSTTLAGLTSVTSTGFTGALTGNATTATTLATARTINGTSFNGSANITTANWGTARTLTIGTTGKSVNGSADVAWSLAEIGAAAVGNTVNLTGDQTVAGIKSFTSSTSTVGPVYHKTGATNGQSVTAYNLGQIMNANSAATGAIVFVCDQVIAANLMAQLHIEHRGYTSGRSTSHIVNAYYQTSGVINNAGRVTVGYDNTTLVRVGLTATLQPFVMLGAADTVWTYPQLSMTEALLSWSGATDAIAQAKWTATLVTDLTAYANNVTALQEVLATSITGNAATVTNGVYTTGDQSIAGIKSFTSPVRATGGTVAAPSYTFTTDTDTGMYSFGTNQLGFTAGGGVRAMVHAAGLRVGDNMSSTFSNLNIGFLDSVTWDGFPQVVVTGQNGPTARAGDLIIKARSDTARSVEIWTGTTPSVKFKVPETGVITASVGITVTGEVSATSFNSTSTARVKSAITDLNTSYVDKFSMLKPREYDRIDYTGHEFGFIAEEMNEIYPEIVGKDSTGLPSGIDYSKLATILTAKVQEQQTVIDQLKEQMTMVMELLKGVK